MPKFKVVNPDAPEEIDFYQDIPLVDPDTGADQLDSDGNILVKRYVNHTVSIKGITEVKDALPAIKTNTKNLEELYQYSHAQNEAQQIAINENSNAIVDLSTSTSEMALDLETLKNKINSIQGIDIDDLKDYVYTQVPLIKDSYLPLVGGTITGNLTIEEGTITGSLTGVASKATADVNNKELTSYVADIMGANAQLSIIKGDGTTSVISINNILNAAKATNADNATNLGGYPATDYIRSVNGINADENGNVTINAVADSTLSLKGIRTSFGWWTITELTPYKPLFIIYNATSTSEGKYGMHVYFANVSNCVGSIPSNQFIQITYSRPYYIVIPTASSITINVSKENIMGLNYGVINDTNWLKAYQ